MSYTTFAWGSENTIPNPDIDGIRHDPPQFVGSMRRVLSGEARIDAIASKRRTTCVFSNRSKSDRDHLEQIWNAHAKYEEVVTFPDGVSYTAIAYHNGFQCVPWFTGLGASMTPIYTVTITWDEV